MHHKKRIHKNFTVSKRYNINHYHVNRLERLERNIFFLFALAVITSMIFLYSYSPITGNAILSSQLDQSSYDAGEKITGTVSLQMQEGDILPEDSKISVIISGDQVKCQTKYICSVSGEIDWYKINSTSGECYLKNADPESKCCSLNSANCNQIIKNSGFEDGLDNWTFSRTGDSATTKASEQLTVLYDEDDDGEDETIYDSMAAKLSTIGISSSAAKTASATLTQNFATPIIVGSLTSNQPNLIISDLRYSIIGFDLYYSVTVCNTGYGKTTKPFYVKIIVKQSEGSSGYTSSYQIKQNMSSGQCITNLTRATLTTPTQIINATVDPLRSITELNELDNSKIITITNYYEKNLEFGENNITYNNATKKINYTVEICNRYNATLNSFIVSVYSPNSTYNLWNENTPTMSTTVTGQISFPQLTSGSCEKRSFIYNAVNLINGTYYYWLWIDKENATKNNPADDKLQDAFTIGKTGGVHEEAVYSTDKLNNDIEDETTLLFDTTPLSGSTEDFSLGWVAYADLSSAINSGCAFDITINGKNATGSVEKKLHYYYKLNYLCSHPAPNSTDKYLDLNYDSESGLIDVYTDLYSNWIVAYPNGGLDILTGISITSWGYVDADTNVYGQSVYFDNIRLDKTSNLQSTNEMSCEAQDKICCLEGAGSGVYYGEQLSCSEGYRCWEKCVQKEFTLTQFIAASSTSSKYNQTEGDCYDAGSGTDLVDYCGENYTGCDDCVGEGYTACSDTSSTAKSSCRNWDNTYTVNLSKLSLYAPSSNGTYYVRLLFSYKTTETESISSERINISTYELPLIVGAGEPLVVPTCLDIDYINCTGTWSQCDAYNTKTRTALCYYSGTQVCPSTKSLSQTEQCYIQSNITTCTEYDWSCDDWSTCEGGSQIRTCNLASSSCDATLSGSYVPLQQQACETTEKGTGFDTKYLIYGGLGLILLVGIFFLIKFLISHESKKESTYQPSESSTAKKEKEKIEEKENYPELASYIKDALAAGMNPSEIRLKLQEAGWPKNIIDSVFKKFE